MIGQRNLIAGFSSNFFPQKELCKEFLWEETKNGWKLSRKWNKTQRVYPEGTLVLGVRQVWGMSDPYRTSYS